MHSSHLLRHLLRNANVSIRVVSLDALAKLTRLGDGIWHLGQGFFGVLQHHVDRGNGAITGDQLLVQQRLGQGNFQFLL